MANPTLETRLSHLDFENAGTRTQSGSMPLPDEVPLRQDLSHLPKEILKSSTVENLISQNEDLMARLKVSLRRLSLLENENQKLSEEMAKTRLSHSSFTDQVMVWKEKDHLWRQKVDQLEKEKAIQGEKLKALTEKSKNLSADLARHVKYQERIRTQVKPYVSQLKEYSQMQDLKVADLEKTVSTKEALLRDIRHQMIEVTKNCQYQVEVSEKKSREMVEFYEVQIENLSKEVRMLHQVQEELEVKNTKLHASLERQDLLENENVALRRTKEEIKIRLEKDIERLQDRLSELTRQNQKLGVEHADLQIRVVEDGERLQKVEKENFHLQEQLESLRFMWNAKNEENERLKMGASALERLNLELSQKINEIRKEEGL